MDRVGVDRRRSPAARLSRSPSAPGYVIDYQFVVELNSPAGVPFGGYRLTLGSPVSSGRLVPLDANLMPLDTSQGPALDRIKYWRVERLGPRRTHPGSELLAAFGTVNTPGDAGGWRPSPALHLAALRAG